MLRDVAVAARLELRRDRVRADRDAGALRGLVATDGRCTRSRARGPERLDARAPRDVRQYVLIAYYTVAQGIVGLLLVHGFPRWVSLRPWPLRPRRVVAGLARCFCRARSSGRCTSWRSTASHARCARAARQRQWLGVGDRAMGVGVAHGDRAGWRSARHRACARAAAHGFLDADHGRRRRARRARDRVGGVARDAGARMRMIARAAAVARRVLAARRCPRAARRRATPSAAACCCASTVAARATAFPASRPPTATSARRSIGVARRVYLAGTLPNSPANMARFIRAPQSSSRRR